jgi:ureidoacrylate peracid hydrolase
MPTDFESWMNGEERDAFNVPTSDVAVIVVDMQNWFCKDEPGQVRPKGRGIDNFAKAIPGCVALVEAAREAGHMVIFTRYVHMQDNIDEKRPMGRRAQKAPGEKILEPGTWGIELLDEFNVRPDEPVIDKSRPSSFYGTRLEPLLTANGIKSVVICGVTTNICVETTARDASQRGYDTYVVEDATGEFEMSRHWHSLYTIEWSFGSVVKVADVQRSWGVDVAAPVAQEALAG